MLNFTIKVIPWTLNYLDKSRHIYLTIAKLEIVVTKKDRPFFLVQLCGSEIKPLKSRMEGRVNYRRTKLALATVALLKVSPST